MLIPSDTAGAAGAAADTTTTTTTTAPGDAGTGNPDGAAGQPPAGNDTATPSAAGPAGDGADKKQAPAKGAKLDGKGDTDPGEGSGDGGDNADKNDGGETQYSFTYPDGFTGLPGVEEKLSAFAKERQLTQEQAQELASLSVDATREYFAGLDQQLEEQKKAWREELANDPEFGGKNLKATNENANRALKHFAPELIPRLAEWNLDEQSDLIKAFARIGKTLRENKSPKGGAPAGKPKSIVEEKAELLARIEQDSRNSRD